MGWRDLIKFLNFLIIISIAVSCGGPAGDELSDGVGSVDHRIFISSEIYNGSFSAPNSLTGIAAANANCLRLSQAQGLLRNYKAILSDSTQTAKERLFITGAVFTVAGTVATQITSTTADFWSANTKALLNDIDRDESGSSVNSTEKVWTGTTVTGGLDAQTCLNWANSTAGEDGSIGALNSLDGSWIEDAGASSTCSTSHRIYCISQ